MEIDKTKPHTIKLQPSPRSLSKKVSLPHFKYIPPKNLPKSLRLKKLNIFSTQSVSPSKPSSLPSISQKEIYKTYEHPGRRHFSVGRNSQSILLSLKRYEKLQREKERNSLAFEECSKILQKKSRRKEQDAAWVENVMSMFDAQCGRKPNHLLESIHESQRNKYKTEMEHNKKATINDIAYEIEAWLKVKNEVGPQSVKGRFKYIDNVEQELRYSRANRDSLLKFEIRPKAARNSPLNSTEMYQKFAKRVEKCLDEVEGIGERANLVKTKDPIRKELVAEFEAAVRNGDEKAAAKCLEENEMLIRQRFSVNFYFQQ
eukprot:TRINITY_DN562_c0_g1_i12.p4 TRINITY_DN562_c0_g1~~TRINITY_DN562_c0_g1_i12.p4  ORF type:complete len:347 (+),score=29.91 TRINITY_DN562_c0_g1_i12:95-1042(+)